MSWKVVPSLSLFWKYLWQVGIIFVFQQHYIGVLVDPNSCQHLVLSVVFIKTIVLGLSWYLVFLICIFLITNYVDDLFMGLLAIDIIFWWSVYSNLLFNYISTLWQIKKSRYSNIKDDYRHESQHIEMYGFSFVLLLLLLLQCVEVFVFFLLSFASSLCNLGVSFLSDMWFTDFFF